MSIRRSLAYSFAQRYAGFVVSFAATMALARLLTPAEIGVYSVGAAFVGLAQILRDFGVGRYLVQERELTEAHVQSALGVGLILGALIAGLLYLVAGPVAEFYRADELAQVLHVLSLSFLLIPFTTPAMALLERELAFNLTFRVNVLNAVAHAATGVSLAYAGFGPISLAWASFAGVTTSLLALLVLRPRNVLRLPSLLHWRRIMSFGGQSSLASIVGHLGTQAPDLIVGRLLGLPAVAFYSRAQGLIQIFQQHFLRSIADVAFPAYARAHREGGDVKEPYLRGVSYVTAIAWPFFGTLFLLSEPLIVILFGEQWRPSDPLAKALCLAGGVTALYSLSPQLMIGFGQIRKFLRFVVSVEIVRIILIFGSAHYFQTISSVAWSQLPATAVGLVVATYYLRRIAGIKAIDVAKAVGRSAVVSVLTIAACAAFLWSADHIEILPKFAAASLIAGTTWLVSIAAVRHPLWREMRLFLSHILGFAFVQKLLRFRRLGSHST